MTEKPKFVSMPDALLEFEQGLESQTEDDFVGTGFSTHDRVLGRLRKSELAFVGARPGMGKTAFLLSMTLNQLKKNLCVYFFTLEMSRRIMMARLVSIETGIKLLEIIERRLSEEQVRQIVGALPQIRGLKGEWATEPLLPEIEKLFHEIKPRSSSVVYVDFVGMIDVPDVRAGDAYAATTEVARALKRFAMQWEIPVIAAAQLNRQVETRKDNRPKLSDFRDSGRLEEVGDIVLGLYRPGYYDKERPDDTLEVLCLKNKNGPLQNYKLTWDPECAHAWERAKL